ncbi:MAG: response regulator transcription factor [Campylobacterales bacterium]|nr:response regulator transcription factor [Campylobacterales bacterium]
MQAKILLVEDDDELSFIITRYLSSRDFKVVSVSNALSVFGFLTDDYDLLILDLTLPDIDGLELIPKIRAKSNIPIIISSARDDLTDKIIGLERGADDYLAKPYDPRELEARIKSILRRKSDQIQSNTSHTFQIDYNNHIIYFHNKPLDLTLAQYDIMDLLIQRKNGVVSRDELIDYSEYIDDSSSLKNIDVLISHIRKKLSLIDSKNHIKTVRGIGYSLLD